MIEPPCQKAQNARQKRSSRGEQFFTGFRAYNSKTVDDISKLLRAWTGGDQNALEDLIPIVYGELRRLAHHYMKSERTGHSLQTTALVHEAYLRLVDCERMQWQ